jgi:SAM-dependent methyltransferase
MISKARPVPSPFLKDDILEVYRNHPLQLRNLLTRLRAQHRSFKKLSEWDLAFDGTAQITDQNHIGGPSFVIEMALQTNICSTQRVIDLGSGLGGAARVLATVFGCRVHGIDLSPERYFDALKLTEMVRLSKLVTFENRDFLKPLAINKKYDVAWGQSAWAHVQDKRKLIQILRRFLKSGGIVAMEDAFLSGKRISGRYKHLILRLEYLWKSHLISIVDWKRLLVDEEFEMALCEDKTVEMNAHFTILQNVQSLATLPPEEEEAWRTAMQLSRAGHLKYYRVIARNRKLNTRRRSSSFVKD